MACDVRFVSTHHCENIHVIRENRRRRVLVFVRISIVSEDFAIADETDFYRAPRLGLFVFRSVMRDRRRSLLTHQLYDI